MRALLFSAVTLCALTSLAHAQVASDEHAHDEGTQGESAKDEDTRKLRLLVGAGYGTQDDTDAPSFGEALAFRASYAPVGLLHVGMQGTFHIGSEFGDELNRVHYYGLEAGLSLALKPVTLTPYLTGGIAFIASQRNTEASFSTGYYGLGALFDVAAPDYLLVGIDTRFVIFQEAVVQEDNIGSLSTVDLLLMFGVLL